MIWIEHDMQMVADLADRIHVLNYGRTLAEGAPDEVLKDQRVIAAYVGRVGHSDSQNPQAWKTRVTIGSRITAAWIHGRSVSGFRRLRLLYVSYWRPGGTLPTQPAREQW